MRTLTSFNKTLHSYKLLCAFLFVFISGSILGKGLIDKIEVAPFMRVTELAGGDNMIQGLHVKTFAFKTEKENKGIATYYKKLWKGKIKSVEGPNWFYHSNYNGEYLTVVQVKKEAQGFGFGSNVTSGLISVSEPNEVQSGEGKNKVELFYPLVLGVNILSDLSTIDLGKKSRTTVLDVPGGVLHNLRHYQSYFSAKGWQEAYSDMANEMVKRFGGTSLIMQKGSDELILSFIPGDDKGRTNVVGVYVKKNISE